MDRRDYLAGAGSALAAATAGCGFILGTEAATFSASPAVASDTAVQETGYEKQKEQEKTIEKEFSAAGQTRTVKVTNVMTMYEKSVDLGPLGDQRAAVFTCLTTPKVEILDRSFNPVADWDAEKLARLVQEQYSGFENLQEQAESQVTVGGSQTVQVEFVGDATLAGSSVDVTLHISEAAELGDDFVVTFGAYPQLKESEGDNVLALMESIQRP
ncbi:DUF6517 family protein [Halobacteriales archaeon Cl-PHB]